MEASKINRLESTKLIGPMVDEHWRRLRLAKERGQQTVWCAGTQYLLTSSQGIPTHFMAGFAAYVAGRKLGPVLFDAAADDGQLPDACSYHRLHMGLLALHRKGLPVPEQAWLPVPDFAILSRICTEHSHYLESMFRQFGVPIVVVDHPPHHSEAHRERNVRFVERQMREVAVPAIEKLTGRRYDFDRLSEALVVLKKAAIIRNQCLELMKNVPCPCTMVDLTVSLAPIMYMAGMPGTVEYYEKFKAELEDRVAQKIGAITPEEKYRLYWDHILMWGWLGPLSRKLTSFGANLVAGRYPFGMHMQPERIDPERPLWSLADQWTNIPCSMPQSAVKLIGQWVEDYHLDGLLMLSSPTCRLFNGAQQDIMDEIERKYGVPGIMFEGDMVDPHFYSEAQLDTRLQALFEMIDGRRVARRV